MNEAKVIARLTGAMALTAVVGAGCFRAEAQTVITNRVASTNFTMNGFQKPSQLELKQKLSPAQFEVTQNAATEPAFHNEFWDN